MAETKELKIRFSTVICIILIVLLLAGCIALYYFGFIQKDNKISELEKEAIELKTEVEELKVEVENSQAVLKTKEEKVNQQEIYKLAIEDQKFFIDSLIVRKEYLKKDFSKKDFTDEEIILALPYSSEGNIFKEYDKEEGFYSKASITDVEKSAKKVFGKTIDVKNAENGKSITILNNDVVVEVASGFGVVKDELISVKELGENDYIIEFKHISDTTATYKLTVNYEKGNVIYKGLEK